MNFKIEYVRPRSGRCLGREATERSTKSRERSFVRRVLNKQDEGLFRKSTQSVNREGGRERGKLEYPEKNLSEQSREPTTNSTHISPGARKRKVGRVLASNEAYYVSLADNFTV